MPQNEAIISALKYKDEGDMLRARQTLENILAEQPADPRACLILAEINYLENDFNSAINCLKQALQNSNDNPEICNNLGLLLHYEKKTDEAIYYFRKALKMDPLSSEACYNLGISLEDKGDIDEAIICYKKALEINPALFDAYLNLGCSLLKKGDLPEAVEIFYKAVSIKPDSADVYYNLGIALQKMGQADEAILCYQNCIRLNPDIADAANNLGVIFQEKGQLEEAIEYYQKALRSNPTLADALNNTGNALKDRGMIREAQTYYRQALQIKPDHAVAYSNILFTMNYDSMYDAQSIFNEHLGFAKRLAEPLCPVPVFHDNDRSSDRRLRIGYVSPDFRQHSVACFIEPVLSTHNHEKYEIFCYSDVLLPDNVTKRIQGYADCWRNILGMSDDGAAEIILSDKIDILIDLAGHTAKNRMLMFARKPAPIQISWIGYPATTGLSVMDYKIVDHYTDPEGMTEKYYTEQLLRMPVSFLCYLPYEDSPEAGPLPALNNGYVTFGSFNNLSKISLQTLEIWTEIMNRIPSSRLILKNQSFADSGARKRITEILTKKDVSEERIELLSHEPSMKKHLALYNRIDIALDTFPYHGTTTTCEALWMGVPVITLAGNTHVSRVGVSILSNIGLPEFIAKNKDEFINTALHLANDSNKLQILRKSLRQNMRDSALCNKKRFAYNLEAFLRSTWNKWC